MQGVIIWYSRADFQAIIWCEDCKDLAIASGPTAWRNPMSVVDIGDVVAFNVHPGGSERRCTDLRQVAPSVSPSLPDSIRRQRSIPQSPVAVPARSSGNRLLHLCASHD